MGGRIRAFTIVAITFFYAAIAVVSLKDGYIGLGISILIIAAGASLNFIALSVNNWTMPVFIKHAREKEWLENDRVHSVLNKKTRFKCLCDIHRKKMPDGTIMRISSIGDRLAKAGIILTILSLSSQLF